MALIFELFQHVLYLKKDMEFMNILQVCKLNWLLMLKIRAGLGLRLTTRHAMQQDQASSEELTR